MKTLNGKFWESAYNLEDETAVHVLDGVPASIQVSPAAPDGEVISTAAVSITMAPRALVDAGTALWVPAVIGEGGVVAVADAADIPAPATAIKVAATGSATVYVRELM